MDTTTKKQLIEELKASTQNASGMFEISEDTICALMTMLQGESRMWEPAPVVPEEMFNNIDNPYGDEDLIYEQGKIEGWNACRTAMLQAGNHTEQHLDTVVHSGDDNEKADCRLPFDQWLSQQNEPIDVDCGCVTTEAFYHWLRVAYEAGNSPVTPDCWIPVSERMPDNGGKSRELYLCWGSYFDCDKPDYIPAYFFIHPTNGWSEWEPVEDDCNPKSVIITHWMPLPAAPKKDVL